MEEGGCLASGDWLVGAEQASVVGVGATSCGDVLLVRPADGLVGVVAGGDVGEGGGTGLGWCGPAGGAP